MAKTGDVIWAAGRAWQRMKFTEDGGRWVAWDGSGWTYATRKQLRAESDYQALVSGNHLSGTCCSGECTCAGHAKAGQQMTEPAQLGAVVRAGGQRWVRLEPGQAGVELWYCPDDGERDWAYLNSLGNVTLLCEGVPA